MKVRRRIEPHGDALLGAWLRGLLARTHRNIAIVALANKLARIAWAMLKREGDFTLNHGTIAR